MSESGGKDARLFCGKRYELSEICAAEALKLQYKMLKK